MERLRTSFAASHVLVEGDRHFWRTASIGVATLDGLPDRPAAKHGESIPELVLESLVATADRRMYVAKSTGKNRVASDEPVRPVARDSAAVSGG